MQFAMRCPNASGGAKCGLLSAVARPAATVRSPLALLAILAVVLAPVSVHGCIRCTASGVLQLTSATPGCLRSSSSVSELHSLWTAKTACAAALWVRVAGSAVTVASIVPGSARIYEGFEHDIQPLLACKSLVTGAGRFAGSSKTAALVRLFDDKAATTRIARTGSTITITPGTKYTQMLKPINCVLSYTVVSGCVLGLKAGPEPPPCPKGYGPATASTRPTRICVPCPFGTFSPGGGKACAPCPAGTSGNGTLARATCAKCSSGYKAAGLAYCESCLSYTGDLYLDGDKCSQCPAGSVQLTKVEGGGSQCMSCDHGKLCCTTFPDASFCPPCSPGADMLKAGTRTLPCNNPLQGP